MISDVPEGYDPSLYPRPAVTVDVVLFWLVDDDLKVMLVRRANPPFAGKWAIPGGFVEMNESLEEAAIRELEEETGLSVASIEQFHAFGAPDRDPRTRVISVSYLSLILGDSVEHKAGDDASSTGWFAVDKLPRLAFDHSIIISYAHASLQYELGHNAGRYQLMEGEFRLSELRRQVERVLGKKLDPAIFNLKITSGKILEKTGKQERSEDGTLASLYRYRE